MGLMVVMGLVMGLVMYSHAIDSKKTEVERVEEEAMISELVELVEKRDKLMWALHEVYKLVYDKLHLRIPERVVGKMAESVGP